MKKTILAILLAGFLPVFAFSQFTLKAEFRPRTEIRSGYKQLSDSSSLAAFNVSQRTRLSAYFEKDWLKTGISFQDVRLWGDETSYNANGVYGDNASAELNEAWVQLSFLKNSSVRIGRQYFIYDDQRLLTNRNWNQSSVAYDALLYQFSGSKWNLDAAFSFNSDKDTLFGNVYSSKKMKTLNFLHASYKLNQNFTGSLMFLASGFTKNNKSETIYMKGSYGAYLIYNQGPANIWGSFYYQNGKNTYGRDVRAFNVNLNGSYKFEKLTLGAGFTLVSGDKIEAADSTGGGTDNLFDLLYANSHRYYGNMDYFSNMSKGTGNGGLMDVFVTTEYKLTGKTSLLADYHYFTLHQEIYDPRSTSSPKAMLDEPKNLCSEFDLGFRINFSKAVNLQGGYSFLFQTKTLEIIQGKVPAESGFPSWGWMMLTVSPEIFTTK